MLWTVYQGLQLNNIWLRLQEVFIKREIPAGKHKTLLRWIPLCSYSLFLLFFHSLFISFFYIFSSIFISLFFHHISYFILMIDYPIVFFFFLLLFLLYFFFVTYFLVCSFNSLFLLVSPIFSSHNHFSVHWYSLLLLPLFSPFLNIPFIFPVLLSPELLSLKL